MGYSGGPQDLEAFMAVMLTRRSLGTVLGMGLTWLCSCLYQLSSVFCSSSPVCSLLATLPVPDTYGAAMAM